MKEKASTPVRLCNVGAEEKGRETEKSAFIVEEGKASG